MKHDPGLRLRRGTGCLPVQLHWGGSASEIAFEIADAGVRRSGEVDRLVSTTMAVPSDSRMVACDW
jgi:hypothetical protein